MSTNSQNSGPGGVRNLRAMFETKPTDPSTSTSPPSRGRSPAGSEASIHSRPISKVRANFVAVERPNEAGQGQQWGLRKASDVGVMSETNTGNANGNPVLLNAHGQNESDSVPISSQTNGTDVRGADQDTEKQGADEVSKPPSPASKPDETIAAGGKYSNLGSTCILTFCRFNRSRDRRWPRSNPQGLRLRNLSTRTSRSR